MPKTIDGGSKSVLCAEFSGKVRRVAKLIAPRRTEFTVDVQQTIIDDELFTIGNRVNFVVDDAILASGRIMGTLVNLSPGDKVNVKAERKEGKWQVVGLSSQADRGRSFDEYLNDLEEEHKAHQR